MKALSISAHLLGSICLVFWCWVTPTFASVDNANKPLIEERWVKDFIEDNLILMAKESADIKAQILASKQSKTLSSTELALLPSLPPYQGAFDWSLTLVQTRQVASQAQLSESLHSFDIEGTYYWKNIGILHSWIEYSQTPSMLDDALSSQFDSNADAQTTLDSDGRGRAQLSSFYLASHEGLNQNEWLFGLTEVTTLIDSNEIANDEVSQFLTSSLVNNTSIAFPDYALSGKYVIRGEKAGSQINLVISQGKGLADNEGNYAQTLNLDSNNGLFVAVEGKLTLHEDNHSYLGYWRNSVENKQGVYGGIDWQFGEYSRWMSRVGKSWQYTPQAEDEGKETLLVFSTAGVAALGQNEIGLGWHWERANNDNRRGDYFTRITEVYYTRAILPNLKLTLFKQFHNVDGEVHDKVSLLGSRFVLAF